MKTMVMMMFGDNENENNNIIIILFKLCKSVVFFQTEN